MTSSYLVDPELLRRAVDISGDHDPEAVVMRALEEFIARREQEGRLAMLAQLAWDDSFDHKAERSRVDRSG